MLGAGRRDLLQIFGVGIAFFLLLGNSDRDIAAILNFMSSRLKTRFQPRNSDRGRPHVNTTPGLAQIERHSDHANFLGSDVGGADVGRHRKMCNRVIGQFAN